MLREIHFDNQVNFLGRNGVFKCRGFSFANCRDSVTIFPITSKGYDARCFIEIPLNQIDPFVKKLRKTEKEVLRG